MSTKYSPTDFEAWKRTRPKAFSALDPDDVPGAIAVLIFHGMGQQAQFETLNDVTTAFIRCHKEHGWQVKKRQDPWLDSPKDGTVDLLKASADSDQLLPIAQVTLERAGKEQMFDFFEAYWAPLTEGVVGFWDTFRFLLKAALDGVCASLQKRGFHRFVFGEARFYGVGLFAAFQLLVAALVVASLAAVGFAYVAVVAHQLLNFIGTPLHTFDTCTQRLESILFCFLFANAVLLLPVVGNAFFQRISQNPVSKAARIANFVWISPVLAIMVFFGVTIVSSVVTHGSKDLNSWGDSKASYIVALPGFEIAFLLVGAVLSITAWYFTVKYLGDVVAYVSAHSVNRFWQVRERIQERCLGVAKAVYTRKSKQNPNEPLYDQVIIVSHSLGSVIAYDTLNSLIALELCGSVPPCVVNVAERTRLFLTCGSPLDKVAFLFPFKVGLVSSQCTWRDRLSNYREPMILNYRWRPARWINIWSYPDWISGRLSYYELPHVREGELRDWITTSLTQQLVPRALRILNIPDSDAFLPLYEHTTYFRHQTFRTALYNGIWEEASAEWSTASIESEQSQTVGDAA